MPKSSITILNHEEILIRIKRMANEIAEQYCESTEITLLGLNERGFYLAQALTKELSLILPNLAIELVNVNVIDMKLVYNSETNFENKSVLVIDDVINSGRTLMLVLSDLFSKGAKNIQTVFLAKREHRSYPVKADYVGISIATTLQEHVFFDNIAENDLKVYLQ